jgi:hypothetical protein
MAEYCSKMTEYSSKITERYIKMAYSKHKMTEYHGNSGLGAATRGIGVLMRDENEARTGARVGGWGARGVGGARMGGDTWDWLDRSVGWLV